MKEIKYIDTLLQTLKDANSYDLGGTSLFELIDAINWLKQVKFKMESNLAQEKKKQSRPLDDEDEEE